MEGHKSERDNIVSARALEMVAQVRAGSLDAFGRAEQVALQMEAAMGIGILNDGERLPPEQRLAEYLGVSPLTLRQSLAVLRSKGLVETRRGRGGGSYINGTVSVSDTDVKRMLRAHRTDDLRDLADTAGAVASSAARLATLRSDSQDIRRVRDLAERFERANHPDQLRRANSRLHIGLGVASQSRRLTTLTIQLQTELSPISWGEVWDQYRFAAARHHDHLISAIEQRDTAAAERIARDLFDEQGALLIDQHLDLLTMEWESA